MREVTISWMMPMTCVRAVSETHVECAAVVEGKAERGGVGPGEHVGGDGGSLGVSEGERRR